MESGDEYESSVEEIDTLDVTHISETPDNTDEEINALARQQQQRQEVNTVATVNPRQFLTTVTPTEVGVGGDGPTTVSHSAVVHHGHMSQVLDTPSWSRHSREIGTSLTDRQMPELSNYKEQV